MPNPTVFQCPVCRLPLAHRGSSYSCENRHTYDVAKEGYVNLLLAQRRHSKEPGDSDEMIRSRQHFLNQGYYSELANAIAQRVGSSPTVLDIGCSEVYYLGVIQEQMPTTKFTGIDISKPAVSLAARRKLGADLAVASAYDLPIADESIQTVLSVFSPIDPRETARVLISGVHLIMVGSGERHLTELASKIYTEVTPHQGNFQVLDDDDRFEVTEETEMTDTITIKGQDIFDLLTMTPYYWHTRPEQKEDLSKLETTIHFVIRVYTKP